MPNIQCRGKETSLWAVYGMRLWNEDEYRYVGYTTVGILSRSKEHMKDAKKYSTAVYNWYWKYAGSVQIVMEVIEECPNDDIQYVKFREQFWIATYRDQYRLGIRNKPLLNHRDGGDGFNGIKGELHPNYGKPAWNRGVPMSDDQKSLISLARTGKPIHSVDQKLKWSEERSGPGNPMYGKRGEDHPAFGYKMSDEGKTFRSVRFSGEGNPMYGKIPWNKGLSGDETISGERHGMSKLSELDVRSIRSRYDSGESPSRICTEYGVTVSTICKIGKRQTWKNIE